MTEFKFKGTPGKWFVTDRDKKSPGIDSDQNVSILMWSNEEMEGLCRFDDDDDDEQIANAQLMACAPEMLDFINRISGEMLRSDFVLHEGWYDQAKELIKKATTI